MGHRHGLGLWAFQNKPLVYGEGAHTFMLKGGRSSLLSELCMHANPSHHCLHAVRIVTSGTLQTSISKGLDVTI